MADANQEQRGRGTDSQGLQPNGPSTRWEQSDRVIESNMSIGVVANTANERHEWARSAWGRWDGLAHDGHIVRLADTASGQHVASGTRSNIGAMAESYGAMQTGLEPTGPVNGHWRNADWLLCRDGKWRPVEPGTFPLVNGAPARVGRLRAYGNAINAEAAEAVIRAYMECKPK